MSKRTILKLLAILLVAAAVAFPVLALRNSKHRFFAPRYDGKSIATWFPHWYWPGKAPSSSPAYAGPESLGPEAVPFLVRELSLEEAPEQRMVESLSKRLPASWANRMPRPYPPILHRQNIMLWLDRIVRRPGGPAAIAESSKSASPVPRRRLLHLLSSARSEYPAVLDALRLAIADTDPQIYRIGGRSVLLIDPAVGSALIPPLLHRIGNDLAPDGIEFWRPLLPRLTRYPAHREALKNTLDRLAAVPIPEAAKLRAELEASPSEPTKP